MTIIVRSVPVHAGRIMNIGRYTQLEVNGHTYRLWTWWMPHEDVELTHSQQLATDLGGEYVHISDWKEGDPV